MRAMERPAASAEDGWDAPAPQPDLETPGGVQDFEARRRHVCGCRTLFATHVHELADAADAMPRAVCMAMGASPGSHGDIFTYRVGRGRAGHSHGLKVAALAGMPGLVLARAEALLAGYTGQQPPTQP